MATRMTRTFLLPLIASVLALAVAYNAAAQQPQPPPPPPGPMGSVPPPAVVPPPPTPFVNSGADRQLAIAFGEGSAELQLPIRMWIADEKIAIAMQSVVIQTPKRVKTNRLSIALFRDEKDGVAVKTVRVGEAVLTLDRESPTVQDLVKCRILAIEAIQSGMVELPRINAPATTAVAGSPGTAVKEQDIEVKEIVANANFLKVSAGPNSELRFKFEFKPQTPLSALVPAPRAVKPALPHWTNEDLARVPEMAFGEPIAKTLPKEKALEATAHILAKINHVNRQKTDGFVLALRDQRADLRGLPFLMGDACRTREDQARMFTLIADHVRQTLQGSKNVTAMTDEAEQFFYKMRVINLANIVAATKAGMNRNNMDCVHRATVAALMQILMPESELYRTGLAKYLATVPHIDATRALARLALFSPEDEVRAAAIEGLKVRRERDYTDLVLQGFDYPLPAVSKRAAEALVKLDRKDVLPSFIAVLERPDPRLPVTTKQNGKDVSVVRELVKINHHRNCALCHAPGNTETTPEGVLTVAVPLPNEPLAKASQGGYQNTPPPSPDIVVRIDMTYLRQDFSLMMPVADPHPWPEMQRFDFLVRTRTLTAAEAAEYEPCCAVEEPGRLSPYHRAALFALRELTGRDTEPTAAAWRKLLQLPARN